MRRIGLAVLVSLSLFAVPLAGAQQAPKITQIGILSAFSPSAREEALLRGLRDLGYVEGQNVTIQSRYAEGRFEKLSDLAAELVQLNVDVIVASPTAAIRAPSERPRPSRSSWRSVAIPWAVALSLALRIQVEISLG